MALLEQTVEEPRMQQSDAQTVPQVGNKGAMAYPPDGSQQTVGQKIMNFSVEFGPSRKDILNFTNQISVMIKAGISLPEALEAIGEQTEKQKFSAIILDLKERIESGQSFSQALAEHRDVFGSLYVNMVAAAEISGSMSSMLLRLAEYLDQEQETRSQVTTAMVYPIIIAVMAVSTTFFLLMFVLPKFLMVFAGKEHLLPAPTKIIMAVSLFLRGYWFIVLPGMAGACCAFWYFINTNVGKVWWDKTKLKIPLLKTLCRCLYITRSLHTMGVLTAAGVPILDTISITSQISGNVLYEKMWKTVHDAVRQGRKITESLQGFALMPSSVVRMIRAGEDSGTLSDVLKDVAEFYSRELKTVIKMVTSMIEPIMIVVMGALVGFIASSIILPIFKMSKVVTS
ncbi:MAG: type II secretion system F family protein [Planctomycetota bacterium]|jgi:type IV pilus assembly protein PilC